ncbi:enoyl-CoA hydratase/isomerase [Teredinibacter turnerae]|uniref:enoyl-CoA hydratase/isomerase n=1 Tax=Teredinibacter turnerae TaxID=2426 RepID=UPI0005F775D5|nr:enoyl-CoA hydratase/isomerase [Teredinibacter turnerae]
MDSVITKSLIESGNCSSLETVRVRFDAEICYLQIYRPDANNSINEKLIDECLQVLAICETEANIVVVEGLPEVFCFGADFNGISKSYSSGSLRSQNPEPLYEVWYRLATGPFISVAHVRGKANAGGVGFVAACDIVICEDVSTFSLSELIFDLIPACVLPFLVRRIGHARANFMSLMTMPISANQAQEWGLVDICDTNTKNALRKQLIRLRRLSKTGIRRQKNYMNSINDDLQSNRSKAIAANEEIFSDPKNLEKIHRYVTTGKFPWEGDDQ